MSQAFPADLKTLTSWRFWAALWVLLFHYRPYLGVEAVSWGVLQKRYLAVDFFFMLSGFLLAHVYRGQLQAGAYSHGGFVLKRRRASIRCISRRWRPSWRSGCWRRPPACTSRTPAAMIGASCRRRSCWFTPGSARARRSTSQAGRSAQSSLPIATSRW